MRRRHSLITGLLVVLLTATQSRAEVTTLNDLEAQVGAVRYRSVTALAVAACAPCHNAHSSPLPYEVFRALDETARAVYVRLSMELLAMPPDPILRQIYRLKLGNLGP